jgi:hypothetical protein
MILNRRAFFDRPRGERRRLAHYHPRHECDSAQGAQHRSRARAVRRWLMLVRGDRALAGVRAQCDVRAKPSDDATRSGRVGAARARAAGWPDGSGRAFLFWSDHSEAGIHPNVSALVYVAARAPDAGEDYTALAKKFLTPPASAGIVFDGDEGRLSEAAFLRDFAGDLPEAKAKVLYAVQEPFHKALLAGKTMHAAWRSKPSFYAVSTEDRTINPDLERLLTKRMGVKTIEVKSSHLSLISHPDEITSLILEAARQRG